MGDEGLAALTRRWRQTSSVQDEIALLGARRLSAAAACKAAGFAAGVPAAADAESSARKALEQGANALLYAVPIAERPDSDHVKVAARNDVGARLAPWILGRITAPEVPGLPP